MLTRPGRVAPQEKTVSDIELYSNLTCPQCGQQSRERMLENACQFFYDCPSCGALLRPKPGDCCVFCSYGDVKCPPVQAEKGCCS
jgi:hypothetical protein